MPMMPPQKNRKMILMIGIGEAVGKEGEGEEEGEEGMVGTDVQTTLRQEWEKEFYGEGQYYYYLKRNGITSVSGPNGSKKPNYIIPLPESETDNRRD